jgi:hypothetical protein
VPSAARSGRRLAEALARRRPPFGLNLPCGQDSADAGSDRGSDVFGEAALSAVFAPAAAIGRVTVVLEQALTHRLRASGNNFSQSCHTGKSGILRRARGRLGQVASAQAAHAGMA